MDKSTFQFKGYKIKKSLIEFTDNYNPDETSLKIKFEPSGIISKSDNIFIIELTINIFDAENSNLNIEIITKGIYRFDSNMELDKLNSLFYVNAPAILFPYIRAHISTISVLSGIDTIVLPTLNMRSIGVQLKENTSIVD